MKNFKEFMVSAKLNVVPEPIHFKRRGLIKRPHQDAAVIPGAIHFKYVLPSTKLSEDTDPVRLAAQNKDVDKAMGHEDTWFGSPGHAERVAKHENLSKQLHGIQKKAGIKLTKEHKDHIGFYTEGEEGGPSYEINSRRIDNYKNKKPPQHGMREYDAKVDSTIHSLANNPIGKAHSVYSGVGFNPQTLVNRSKSGTMYSPAHISTTHDPGTAKSFAEMNAGAADKYPSAAEIFSGFAQSTDTFTLPEFMGGWKVKWGETILGDITPLATDTTSITGFTTISTVLVGSIDSGAVGAFVVHRKSFNNSSVTVFFDEWASQVQTGSGYWWCAIGK